MGNTLRAVVVGINEYGDTRHRKKSRLQFARADADEIARVLDISNAFSAKRIDLLTNERATEARVRRSLHDVFSHDRSYDNTIALLYFSGHGIYHPIDERVILACQDVDFSNPYSGGIQLNHIYHMLQTCSATCAIAIIDACYSGGIIDLTHEHESPAEQARKAIEFLRGAGNKTIAIFAACHADEKTRESEDHHHGIYTYELLRGLRDGLARDEQGVVDIDGLAKFLKTRFAEIKGGPLSSVFGGTPIPLWYGEPRSPEAPRKPVEPIKPTSALTSFDGTEKIPIHEEIYGQLGMRTKKVSRTQALAIIVPLLGLIACGLLTGFTPLRIVFLVAVFVWGLLLAGTSIWLGRWLLAPLALVQAALLAGFGYNHFGWGMKLAPLAWLAGLEWLFWTLIAVESLIVAVIVLIGLMS